MVDAHQSMNSYSELVTKFDNKYCALLLEKTLQILYIFASFQK